MAEDESSKGGANFFTGQLLVAMPGMGDPRFERSVVFLCDHSDNGAMGIIVNKPTPELKFKILLKQLEIETTQEIASTPVHFGGPVEHGRGFVLHSGDYAVQGGSMMVNPNFAMTATLDVLQDMAKGDGPSKAILALGYSGWGPGQLEGEIKANGWLVAPGDPELVFDESNADKWEAAMRSINIDPRLLSGEGGSA